MRPVPRDDRGDHPDHPARPAQPEHPAQPAYAVVVPTIGRPSLGRLLASLASQDGPAPVEVVLVDDRAGDVVEPLDLGATTTTATATATTASAACGPSLPAPRVVRSFGRGPAAARNLGWQVAGAPWIAFLDDDVEVPPGWASALGADLAAATERTGATQGRLSIPLPTHRRPTDWERGTAGLAGAAWATADMAYRRAALVAVAGFDERFPRAYREDADLALRVRRAGWDLVRGRRTTVHPVRPADGWVSVRVQRGNADDSLLRALHGRGWREAAQAPPGRLRWHAATAAALVLALAAALAGRRRLAAVAALAWAVLTGDFARRRIAPGPRDAAEVRRMLTTSAVIPPVALAHRVRGWWRSRGAQPWPLPVAAVLLDRDGTLVKDVPYNGDPSLVVPVPGAPAALARLRAAGVRLGVVTNQSGIGRGLITAEQAGAVNAAVDAALGPFSTWQVCPHAPEAGCRCRKPAPGMVLAGAAVLGVPVSRLAVIGDIGADVEAARAAGARGVLVPTTTTLAGEVADAPCVAADLSGAVDALLGGSR